MSGMMVDGAWKTEDDIPRENGRFRRSTTSFRDWISSDGSLEFPAEAGRYHLYIAWACPWAHRTAILRKLKGLEDAVGLSAIGSFMGDDGWASTINRASSRTPPAAPTSCARSTRRPTLATPAA